MRWMLFELCMLCLWSTSLVAQEAEDQHVPKTHWNFGFHVTARNSPGNQLWGFPERIRDVPIHEDDSRFSGNPFMEEPMPDTLLVMAKPSAVEFQVTVNPAPALILGVILGMRSADGGVDTEYRYQQNQGGTPSRGVGTSLRWYETGVKTAQISVMAMTATPWKHMGPNVRLRLLGGGVLDLTGMKIIARAGWDRWNSDQDWDDEVLAVLHEHRLQFGLEVGLAELDKGEDYMGVMLSLQLLYTRSLDHFHVRAKNLQYREMRNRDKFLLVLGVRFG